MRSRMIDRVEQPAVIHSRPVTGPTIVVGFLKRPGRVIEGGAAIEQRV